MKDVMIYKGYFASIRYSSADEVFHGKIEGINDLVSFEGDSVQKLKRAFHESVDEYLDLCRREGKEPEKPAKGSFNVRLKPAIHRKAILKAARRGITLNQLVQQAVEKEVEQPV